MKQKITLFAIVLLSFCVKSQNLYFPPTTGNVWDSILPSSLNYCQPRIDSLYNYLQAKNTKSFILLKDGKRVLEKYFGTYKRDSIWYWASASKSLASFITGIAQQKGYININNTASQYLGAGWTSAPTAKENLITIKHLITMTSGLNDAPASPCTNEDTAKTCLTYLADAGTRWAYHTGAYRKVQDVVSNAVGQNYNLITNNWIEAKTGMSGTWVQQVYYSKARDMARFGLLNLNKGIWNTDTLLKDTSYFRAMTNTSQNLNLAYGYLWWLNGKASGMAPGYQIVFPGPLMSNAPNDMYAALGKNDQKIYVVPSKNLVVVRQGNTAGGFSLAASAFDNVLWDYINKLDCSVTSVKDNWAEPSYRIYPNPVTDVLTVENPSLIISTIKLYDIFGALVYEDNPISETTLIHLDFSQFSKGLYVVEIENLNKSSSRYKLMKY
ncbi:MAG: serine hydrolase [Bacteroidetes bacterium]|nr:serine hydrolase [Bacteroidota bacterium]